MKRTTTVRSIRLGGAAAIVAALVVGGSVIAGAASHGAASGPAGVALSARAANHGHGPAKIHGIEGVIATVNGSTSIAVSTPKLSNFTVMFGPNTVFVVGHTRSTTVPILWVGERVNVTPAKGSTMTSYTAALVRVQPTKVHPIEGVIASVNGTTSMVVSVHRNVQRTIMLSTGVAPTTVTLGRTTVGLVNLVAGERVHITPTSTSTAAAYTAATVAIQSTKVHPIEGVISAFDYPTSMTITTVANPTGTLIDFGPETLVANGSTVGPLTALNLAALDNVHVVLVPGATAPVALLVSVQPQS